MNQPNIKIYLAVSGALIVLFLLVTFYPFGKKQNTNNQLLNTNGPTPTIVETNSSAINNFPTPTLAPADFTGVADEVIPQDIVDSSTQKQELRSKVPFDTGLFQIDFDYAEDKFIVTLNEPKSENRRQFDQWLKENYSLLNINQFNFR